VKIKLVFKTSNFAYTAPITVLKSSFSKNKALNVSIFKNDQLINKIDLTVLPKFHQYNLTQWKYTLENFFNNNSLNLLHVSLEKPLFNMVENRPENFFEGELLFIIESILFLVIEHCVPEVLNPVNNRIKINALYSKSIKMDSIPECIKIKISPDTQNLDQTIELLNNLFKNKPDIRIRLDGNRQFELLELTNYIEQLEKSCGPILFSAIEFLEEPFKNLYDVHIFNQIYSYKIALDESLLTYKNQLTLLGKLSVGTYLILKPILFGISKSYEILVHASQLNQNVVISSAYEPATAIRPLLFLAALSPSNHHGFDTLKFLPKHLSIQSDNYCLKF
jgi:hypothetical protein